MKAVEVEVLDCTEFEDQKYEMWVGVKNCRPERIEAKSNDGKFTVEPF